MRELRDAVRRLLLPIRPSLEEAAVNAVRDRLQDLGFAEADQAEYVRQLTEEWHATRDQLRGTLKIVVRDAIREGFPEADPDFAAKYDELHVALQEQHVLTFEDSTALLSYAPVMYDLAVDHRMSSSAISRLLAAHGFRDALPWRAVQAVLSALKIKPVLVIGNATQPETIEGTQPETIEGVLAADIREADNRFLDADIAAGAELIGAAAAELGFDEDLKALLLKLCAPDRTKFVPYLQILHFQCMVTAFYDHPLTMAYEFSPRGENANFLLEAYQSLTHTLNAFLNNLKAIEQLNAAWARGRSRERARAHALVAILEGMERVPWLPRREIAAWVRQWLLRLTTFEDQPANPVPTPATVDSVTNVLNNLEAMRDGTGTGGVIEQRIVDALTSTIHTPERGWRARGLGLPVNASNLSSRRLGDCDFQKPPIDGEPPQLVAYEATAGRLNTTYLRGHLQTLRRSTAARIGELEGIAPKEAWRVKVVFVAHRFAGDLDPPALLPADRYHGLTIETEYATYAQLRAKADSTRLVDAFTECVHARLNEPRTPRRARDTFLAML